MSVFLISKSGSGISTGKLQPESAPPPLDFTTISIVYTPGLALEDGVTLITDSATFSPEPLLPSKLLPFCNPAVIVQPLVSAPSELSAVTVN